MHHGLAPARSLPARPESVLDVVRRLSILQFDPLEVPGARNHDLVLHARIHGYKRAWCEAWLYGPDRQLFEVYNKSLNIVPIEDLRYHRISWDRYVDRYEQGILHDQAEVVHNILQRIADEGPLSTAAFKDHAQSVDWWWAPTRVARAVLEALFVTGRVGVARREGNRRYYDLMERLVPDDLMKDHPGPEEGSLHRLLTRFRATGMTSPSANAEVMMATGKAPERARLTAQLVERGDLIPIQVEGVIAIRYAPSTSRSALGSAAADGAFARPTVSFIAPLDQLIWDRRVLRDVWEFDYTWEVYVPEAKRRWGYYVLPVLFGDRLVGRIEPRFDRASKTLRVLGMWWEAGFSPRKQDGFVPQMKAALGDYMRFVGAKSVEWAPATAGAARLFGTPKGT